MSAQQEYKELYAKYKAAIDQLSTVTAERDRAREERDEALSRIEELSNEIIDLRIGLDVAEVKIQQKNRTEASHD